MILGVDTSSYLEMEEHKIRFFEGGEPVNPLDVFRKNGVDTMRIRIWNQPYAEDGAPYLAGTCDIARVEALSRIATEKGYKILPDFHYSDFWADPHKQKIPKEWLGLSLDALCDAVYDFTYQSLVRLVEAGAAIDYVQIGNEITNGMLWPIGQLTETESGPRGNYDSLVRLLKAGISAAKKAVPKIQCILHLERSYDQAVYAEFFDAMAAHDVPYDAIGMSYYPYWHGSMDAFFANVAMCKSRYKKPIFVAELAYAFSLDDYQPSAPGHNNLVVNRENVGTFDFVPPYPFTPEGQCDFVKEFLSRAKKYEIAGVFYWEPAWIPGEGICWASEEGKQYIGELSKETRNEWANQCLFDYAGEKLPACDAFTKIE